MSRHPHILNASSNLLGICFVIITGLKLTGSNGLSLADEITWSASVCFLASILLSYLGLRNDDRILWMQNWAERTFLAGVAGLTLAIFVLAAFVEAESYERTSDQAISTQARPIAAPATTSVR